MTDDTDEDPNEAITQDHVDAGNPSTTRRFKGSGNPKGRPKGSRNRKTIVKQVANEMHSVMEDGRRQRRSTLDLVLLRLRNLALAGKSPRAFEELNRLLKTYEPQGDGEMVGIMVAPAPMTEEEWIAEQEKKNLTRKPPAGYEDPSE